MARQQKPVATEIETTPAPQKTLFDQVAGYLDANDWSYSSYQEQKYFSMCSRLMAGSVRNIVDVYEEDDWRRVLVFSILPNFVPEHRRAAVLESINRINYQTIYGNFEMDQKDGEIRVRTVVESDIPISDAMIERALNSNINTASRFFAPLLAVSFGNASPESILDLECKRDEATLQ